MPRNGAGVYSHPFPNVVEGTTIESAVFNGNTSDVEQDLNTPRPIVAGGTGANNAHDALINLHGEESGQNVTNYDSFPFVAGSFYSVPGATSAPVAGHHFDGICYPHNDPLYVTVEARDLNDTVVPGRKYVRQKLAGTWGPWNVDGRTVIGFNEGIGVAGGDMFFGVSGTTPNSAFIVNDKADVSGTTVFLVTKAGQTIARNGFSVDKTINPSSASVTGTYNNINRWQIELGNGITETGSGNTGSNFSINRFNDAGAYLGTPFSIARDTGNAALANDLTVSGNVYGASLIMTSNGYIGGSLVIGNNNPVGGTLYFGSATTKYLTCDGTNFSFSDGRVNTKGVGATAGSWNPTVTSVDGAALIAAGPWGGGLTFQDGAGRACIWCEGSDLQIGTSSPATRRMIIGNSGVVTIPNVLAVNTINVNTVTVQTDGGLKVQVPAGNYARYNSTVSGMRTWQWGCSPTGEFVITDETAGAFRLNINTAGDWSLNGHDISFAKASGSYGYACKSGVGGGFSGNAFNIWHGTGQQLWIDNTSMGTIAYASDYRIKKDVIDLPGMWDTAKALRPIKYTQAEFMPPSQKTLIAAETLKARKEAEENPDAKPREVNTAPLYPADDIERWGFIAHELQETLIPSAASGVKDAPDTIQSPNPWTVIAVLTKALQEAMTRIEALEGGAARR